MGIRRGPSQAFPLAAMPCRFPRGEPSPRPGRDGARVCPCEAARACGLRKRQGLAALHTDRAPTASACASCCTSCPRASRPHWSSARVPRFRPIASSALRRGFHCAKLPPSACGVVWHRHRASTTNRWEDDAQETDSIRTNGRGMAYGRPASRFSTTGRVAVAPSPQAADDR